MASTTSQQTRSRPVGLAVAVLGGLLVLALAASVFLARANRLRDTWPPEADTFYLPPSSALRVASLRHTELLADLIHARRDGVPAPAADPDGDGGTPVSDGTAQRAADTLQ